MAGKNAAAPWSVKGVERSTRETARQAAGAAGMTVGAWIEQAIRTHQDLLPPPGSTPAPDPMGEVMDAAQRAEVRSLESGVERMEARAGETVIPVALKVQELAHRLVEIEQARVSGKTRRPPEPEAPPPPPEPDFESFLVPEEPEPEPAPLRPAARKPAEPEEFPTPVPPPDDRPLPDFESFKIEEPPEAEPLVFTAEHEIPEERPHRRSWAKPRRKPKAQKSRFRRFLGRLAGSLVALGLGAGTAILVLEHGELVGLPPRLVDHVAEGLDAALHEGQRVAVAGQETVGRWVRDLRGLVEAMLADHDEDKPVEASETPAAPPPTPTASLLPKAERPKPEPAKPEPAKPEPTKVAESKPEPSKSEAVAEVKPEPPKAEPPKSETPTAEAPKPEAPKAETPAPPPAATPPAQSAAVPPPSSTPAPAAPTPSTPPSTESTQGFPTLTQSPEAPPAARETEDLEKVARQGDVKAQYELGVAAAQPETGTPDYGKAAYWFREAAVQGNASAQYNLGVLYEHGLGVGQDDVRALLWYHSAAEQGHPRAQYNLGVFYAQGRGIPTDYGEAQRWFKKAADQGIAKAFYNLAVLAESGLGQQANATAARAYMSRAALMGDPDARAALAKKPAPASKAEPPKATNGGEPPKASTEVIGAVQHMLTELGYDAGRIDGMLGDKTRQAIRKFQSDNGLQQTGVATDDLLDLLTAKIGPAMAPTASRQR